MSIRLVVSDMDGTFLGPTGEVSSVALTAMEALRAQGVGFTFITGRPRSAVAKIAEPLGIDMPIVACNGALIFQGAETYFRRCFSLAPLEDLLTLAHAEGLTVVYSLEDVEYAVAPTHWTERHIKAGRDIASRPIAPADWAVLEVEKVNIFARADGSGFVPLIPYLKTVRETHALSLFGFTGCEIVAQNMNKAEGLRELCKLYNLPLEQVLAIGDNDNDNEMLKVAGIGCAVFNAAPETKLCADYLCKESYAEGVVEAINTFVLQKNGDQ